MARKLAIVMVLAFWGLMTGFFVKRQYFIGRGQHETSKRAVLDTEYRMGVYYGQKRIGEFKFNSYPWESVGEKGYRLASSLWLRYAPVGEARITGESFTDENLFLRNFHYYLRYRLKMFDEEDATLDGKLEAGKLLLKVRWGTFERSFGIPAEDGVRLYDPVTPWIAGERFRPGREYRVEVLNRFTRNRDVAKVKVLRSRKILFDGKEMPGFEVETTVGDLKSVFWVGGDGKVYRMESPVGFSLVREPLADREKEKL